jgi:hypothetical protein
MRPTYSSSSNSNDICFCMDDAANLQGQQQQQQP